MIRVKCNQNATLYYAYHLAKAFLPDREITSEVIPEQEDAVCLEGEISLRAATERELYTALRDLTGQDLPWGMLTGVRPTKLASLWLEEHSAGQEVYPDASDGLDGSCGERQQAFIDWFYKDRFVSEDKAKVAFQIARKERRICRELEGDEPSVLAEGKRYLPGWSLYIGIPFCPSVCSYCSFSSGSIHVYQDRVDRYLEALFREMRQKSKMYGSYPSTVYIGGGTPTSLNEEQLERLLSEADRIFAISEGLKEGKIREYTVEAGRPDSITEGKLRVLKQHGVTRISINPQSMQQKTLDVIGRSHTTQQIRDAFQMARELGFDNINMDIIAGLPGETQADMDDTLRQIREMGPDSLTVHSLAIKRSSAIGIRKKLAEKNGEGSGLAADPGEISRMIDDAYDAAREMGMEPYYLYRQKSIAGNFENIGYARPGKEGLYNILIIEEVQSILACGAGASTKLLYPEAVPNPARNGQLTHMIRRENVKDIDEYIRRWEQETGENHA